MSQDKKNNTNEADVCEACGTIVELGSVINDGDCVLSLPFSGSDRKSVTDLAQKYIDEAKQRFPEVIIATKENSDSEGEHCQLTLTFDCTAEKLIFEMALSTIQ